MIQENGDEMMNGGMVASQREHHNSSSSSVSSKSSTPESVAPSVARADSTEELEDWQRTDEDRKPDVASEALLKVLLLLWAHFIFKIHLKLRTHHLI